jgi:hypothetical protein
MNIKIEEFSTIYGIYDINSKHKQDKIQHLSSTPPEFKMVKITINSILELVQVLNREIDNDKFYGALFLDDDKNPINPLSNHFINNTNLYKYTDVDLYLYYLESTFDKKIVDETMKILEDVTINNLIVQNVNADEVIVVISADETLESQGFHLSDHHEVIDFTKTLSLNYDKDVYRRVKPSIYNAEIEKVLKERWGIEQSIIDYGIKVPTYGIFIHNDGNIETICASSEHPNIKGSSWCTGSNMLYSVIGISELTYGNLNSPMESMIWYNKVETLSKAKGFQKHWIEIIKSLSIF